MGWYLNTVLTCLIGGILPFGACFVELFSIMSSIWMDQYYYVFGFLLIVYAILVVTCAEISIVPPGATAAYVFMYSVAYFARLESNMAVTYVLYFAYMALISIGVFLVTGLVGFF